MSRLIDADKLKKDVLDLPDCYNGFSDTYDKACIIGVIDEQPTIEPKNGKWIPSVDKWGDIVTTVDGYTCSDCGSFNVDKDDFCPNCGSEMQERREDE